MKKIACLVAVGLMVVVAVLFCCHPSVTANDWDDYQDGGDLPENFWEVYDGYADEWYQWIPNDEDEQMWEQMIDLFMDSQFEAPSAIASE